MTVSIKQLLNINMYEYIGYNWGNWKMNLPVIKDGDCLLKRFSVTPPMTGVLSYFIKTCPSLPYLYFITLD